MTNNEMVLSTLDKAKDRILRALPSVVDKERFYEISLGLVRSNVDLRNCSPASVALAVYGIARLGLMPDPVLGHVYVVPFKDIATVVPGYRGLIELARRSGKVTSVHVALVREGDKFRHWIDDDGPHIEHEPILDENGRAIVAGYCITRFADGTRQIHAMSAAAIQKRNTGSPIWKKWPDEQAKKTVIKGAAKLWPLSTEIATALRWDDQAEVGERQSISPQMDDARHPPASDAATDPLLSEVIDTTATEAGPDTPAVPDEPQGDPPASVSVLDALIDYVGNVTEARVDEIAPVVKAFIKQHKWQAAGTDAELIRVALATAKRTDWTTKLPAPTTA